MDNAISVLLTISLLSQWDRNSDASPYCIWIIVSHLATVSSWADKPTNTTASIQDWGWAGNGFEAKDRADEGKEKGNDGLHRIIILVMYKLKDIDKVARRIIEEVDPNRATIIAMEGELGAGKTALTKALAKQLGVKGEIVSPTFVLNIQYEVLSAQYSVRRKLEHVDLWRMEEFGELLQIGLQKMIEERAIIVLEWADKFRVEIENLRSQNLRLIWIKINYLEKDDEREIQIDTIG